MALPLAAIPIIGGIIEKVLDKVAPDKLSDEQRLRLKMETERILRADDSDMDEAFRNFVIQYEGAAADMPRSIQILRGLIRPVMTIAINGFLFYIIWHWFVGANLPDGSELALKIMFALALLVNAFWFGEKMVIRSGLADILKNNWKK
jgi:hypothetical protein